MIRTSRLESMLVNGLLVALALFALFPLVWMLSVSFMHPGEASSLPPPLLPKSPTLDNYRQLFERAGMGRYLANSLLVASAITLLSLLFNLSAGYAFAKLRFAGRDRVFGTLLAALVIPAQVAMIPLFLIMKWLHLVNSYGGVIVPAMATVFGIFLVRQYARSIPDELLEAARIDGAGEWRIFATIVLPLLELERFHVAADCAERSGMADRAGRARCALARARAGQRAHDGRIGRHRRSGAGAVPCVAASLSRRAAARQRERLTCVRSMPASPASRACCSRRRLRLRRTRPDRWTTSPTHPRGRQPRRTRSARACAPLPMPTDRRCA
jgi:multiple sugar transport system permease protein